MRGESHKPSAMALFGWFASRQRGHVARRQLLAAGLSSKTIDRRLASGLLIPVHRGVYRVAHRAPAPLAKEMAAALASGPGALVSHRSAAAVWDMLPYPAAGDVWITNTSERGVGRTGVRVARTRALEPTDVRFTGWLPLTSPARTLLDIAGIVEDHRFESAVAEAQARRLVTETDLRAQVGRSNGRRGAAPLRLLLDRAAPPARTKREAELRMLRLIRAAGLPEPLVNQRAGRFEVDFYWPDHALVAEFDSYEFHTDIRAFRRDRERSNELQLMGIRVLRFTWYHLTRTPRGLEARLREALGLD
jgi:very-short-patch-repair endonuclease